MSAATTTTAPEKNNQDANVHLFGFSKALYLWPIILCGMVLGYFDGSVWAGRLFYSMCIFVAFTIASQLRRNSLVITIVLLIAARIIAPDLVHWLWRKYTFAEFALWSDFALNITLLCTIAFGLSFFSAAIDNWWTAESGSLRQHSFIVKGDTLRIEDMNIIDEYPDVLEWALGLGAGSLVAYSIKEGTVVRRIDNIPFLWYRANKINYLFRKKG